MDKQTYATKKILWSGAKHCPANGYNKILTATLLRSNSISYYNRVGMRVKHNMVGLARGTFSKAKKFIEKTEDLPLEISEGLFRLKMPMPEDLKDVEGGYIKIYTSYLEAMTLQLSENAFRVCLVFLLVADANKGKDKIETSKRSMRGHVGMKHKQFAKALKELEAKQFLFATYCGDYKMYYVINDSKRATEAELALLYPERYDQNGLGFCEKNDQNGLGFCEKVIKTGQHIKESTDLNSNTLNNVGEVDVIDDERNEKPTREIDAKILERLMWNVNEWQSFDFSGFDGGPKGLRLEMMANLARDCNMTRSELEESLRIYADWLINGKSEHVNSPIGYWIKVTRATKKIFTPPDSYLADKHGSLQYTSDEQRKAISREMGGTYKMLMDATNNGMVHLSDLSDHIERKEKESIKTEPEPEQTLSDEQIAANQKILDDILKNLSFMKDEI